MADEVQYSSRPDNKRKFDDPAAGDSTSPFAAPRRATGFSAPVASSPSSDGGSAPPSYNSVPPHVDGIELAKQRAQQIAARLFNDAEAKRPRVDNGGAGADTSVAPPEHFQKHLGQQAPSQVGLSPQSALPSYVYPGSSKKIEIPNGRVGVIIGKGGETIKYLQTQSGAKIQVTRDMDADPNSLTRMVELIGTAEQISRVEQLINEVLSEADAGASGIVTARKFGTVQPGAEQFQMKIPNNKVGLVIGKGGENIKNMQARTGARIQVIPLHLPPGDTSMERTVYIDGTSDQIESAKQLVNEVISEVAIQQCTLKFYPSYMNRPRNPAMAGGYSQQGYRPPRPPTAWGTPPVQQAGYGYMQPGAYPGQPPQYNSPQQPYGNYPPTASGGFTSGWDQTANQPSQPAAPGSTYDYYNQQPPPQQPPPSVGSTAPADGSGYNYSQQLPSYTNQGAYGDSSYSQSAVGQQSHGQDAYSGGYHAPAPQPGYSQSASNPQTAGYDHQGYGAAPGYGSQDGSAPAYGAQGAAGQAPPPQQAPPGQPPVHQGYTGQLPSAASTGYPAGSTPAGYGSAPSGYGSQLPAQTGYGQSAPTYGQPSQTKPHAVYGQGPQAISPQSGYMQQPPVQPGYGQPPQSGYAQDPSYRPPAGYSQQQSYGAAPQSQPSYVQQQQPYADSYSGAAYSQPPVYNDNSAPAAYDGSAAPPTVPAGATKTSPS